MRKKIFNYKDAGGSFLDPESVNSAIRWHVEGYVQKALDRATQKELDHTVVHAECGISLSDCSRWINWEVYSFEDADQRKAMTKKIDAAIAELKKFRASLVTMQKGVAKFHRPKADEDD